MYQSTEPVRSALYVHLHIPIQGCRFTPTCSDYAIQAIETYGVLRGVPKAAWRLLRCGPWCKGGYDPV